MFHLLRWPKRFQLTICGSNFCLKPSEDDEKPLTGFYTNRWVDAFDAEQAKAKAFFSVREKLREKGYGSILGELKLEATEISEVS